MMRIKISVLSTPTTVASLLKKYSNQIIYPSITDELRDEFDANRYSKQEYINVYIDNITVVTDIERRMIAKQKFEICQQAYELAALLKDYLISILTQYYQFQSEDLEEIEFLERAVREIIIE